MVWGFWWFDAGGLICGVLVCRFWRLFEFVVFVALRFLWCYVGCSWFWLVVCCDIVCAFSWVSGGLLGFGWCLVVTCFGDLMLLVWFDVGGWFTCFGWLVSVAADFVLFLALNCC